MNFKPQRVRDPLHNLIEFRANEFENAMWRVVQSPQFQRLRRIKQLGFSELVYPGATHTRFAHSLGVFHTARKLMGVVEEELRGDIETSKENTALAAALVHDLGHGPYSHAFEEVGRRLRFAMADHEKVTDRLIREGEIREALNILGGAFASDVADVIKKSGPASIYGAVVSSQFDADRLDYMQRDRLMTGTHHGAIDFDWLLSNLRVGKVTYGADREAVGEIETFVLGPKAIYAAETYLLGLYQLYTTVYFHKATRGAEKLFTELLVRVIELAQDGSAGKTGLGENHPLIHFAKDPEALRCTLALDDAVIGGALSMMIDAEDALIRDFSRRLRDRKLFKCIDIRERIAEGIRSRTEKKSRDPRIAKPHDLHAGTTKRTNPDRKEKQRIDAVDRACKAAEERLLLFADEDAQAVPRILVDTVERSIYRQFEESKGPLNQIMMRRGFGDDKPIDVASVSQVINAIAPFKALRVYMMDGDEKTKVTVEQIIEEEAKRCRC
ncbi:MAG: HD domain-containing protein [Terracidiphilus sp.]